MGKLIFNMNEASREEMKKMYVRLGGDPKEWERMIAKLDRDRIESLDEIKHIMSQPPHWGKRRPG